MKKALILILAILFIQLDSFCQDYPNIVNCYVNVTNNYGHKIKTCIPFEYSYAISVVKMEGFNMNTTQGKASEISFTITFYVVENTGSERLFASTVTTYGQTTPNVWISDEEGYITFIDQISYCLRFTVNTFDLELRMGKLSYYENWIVIDEPLGISCLSQYFNDKVGYRDRESTKNSRCCRGYLCQTDKKTEGTAKFEIT